MPVRQTNIIRGGIGSTSPDTLRLAAALADWAVENQGGSEEEREAWDATEEDKCLWLCQREQAVEALDKMKGGGGEG